MDPLSTIAFILPAYVANSAPVLSGGRTTVDLKQHFHDGNRIFGDGKTYRGLVVGFAAGTLVGVLLSFTPYFLPQLPFDVRILAAMLLCIGTLAGDLVGSFVKRRIGIGRGGKLEVFDQLLFLAGALLFCAWVTVPALDELAFLAILTYIMHKASNQLAYWLKLKTVPW